MLQKIVHRGDFWFLVLALLLISPFSMWGDIMVDISISGNYYLIAYPIFLLPIAICFVSLGLIYSFFYYKKKTIPMWAMLVHVVLTGAVVAKGLYSIVIIAASQKVTKYYVTDGYDSQELFFRHNRELLISITLFVCIQALFAILVFMGLFRTIK